MDDETRAYFEDVRRDLRELRIQVNALAGLPADVNRLAGNISALDGRVEHLDTRVERLDGRVEQLDTRVERLDGRVEQLDTRVERLEGRLEASAEETRRHFDVASEALRHDMQALAEGVLGNSAAIERLSHELHREMDERFRTVHLAFASVRRDIEELRAQR